VKASNLASGRQFYAVTVLIPMKRAPVPIRQPDGWASERISNE